MLVLRLFEKRTWEILPWLSFNLLISRLSTSLCMVSGRCCISLKTKKAGGKTLTVSKKKKYLLVLFLGMDISKGSSNSIHPLRPWSWLTPRSDELTETALSGLLDKDQLLNVCKDGATCNTTWTSALVVGLTSRLPLRTLNVGKNRCKTKPVICKW